MNKCDSRIMRAAPRGGIDQPHPRRLEALESLLDVVDMHRDMMNAFAAFHHEFFNGRILPCRLEKFDPALADREHRDPNALIIDFIIAGDVQADGVLIDLDGLRQGFHCDSDVIDSHFNLFNSELRTISSTTV